MSPSLNLCAPILCRIKLSNIASIEEVKGVQQVLDQEEEVAMQEFAKFEEKLRQQKGDAAVASTGGQRHA